MPLGDVIGDLEGQLTIPGELSVQAQLCRHRFLPTQRICVIIRVLVLSLLLLLIKVLKQKLSLVIGLLRTDRIVTHCDLIWHAVEDVPSVQLAIDPVLALSKLKQHLLAQLELLASFLLPYGQVDRWARL